MPLTVVYVAASAVLTLHTAMQLWLTLAYRRRRPRPAARVPEVLPTVTVQLPLYNERTVVTALLEHVTSLSYPPELLEIQVLDDSTDATSTLVAQFIAKLPADGPTVQHVRRQLRDGYKAGALAAGLATAGGELVVVLDADFRPAPDFLLRLVPHFADPQVGAVQSRWTHLNREESLLTQLEAFLLDVHFTVDQVGRSELGCFVNFNGSGGIWRAATIVDAGGWDPDTLTEDVDLSYRAQLRGWRFVYRDDVHVPAELPADLRSFRQQQYRWMKGFAQNAARHIPRLLRSPRPVHVKIHGVAHLLEPANFVAMLAVILLTPIVAQSVVDGRTSLWVVLNPLWLLNIALLAPVYISPRRDELGTWPERLRFARLWFAYVSFSMAMTVHNAVAVVDGLLGRRSAFLRTPKAGDDPSAYRVSGFDLTIALELVFASYLAVATVVLAVEGAPYLMWIPILALVGLVGMFASYRRRPAVRGAPRPAAELAGGDA
jgi:cellulose synthase/poly-beta-1,6-N-acetylglucosamine synthase-like glycosyltransferase